jgi:hypothetical protein
VRAAEKRATARGRADRGDPRTPLAPADVPTGGTGGSR